MRFQIERQAIKIGGDFERTFLTDNQSDIGKRRRHSLRGCTDSGVQRTAGIHFRFRPLHQRIVGETGPEIVNDRARLFRAARLNERTRVGIDQQNRILVLFV